jgi:hypothetical protein
MKKILVFGASCLILISCGAEAEESIDKTNDKTDSTVVEEILEEVPPSPTEMATGSWETDLDYIQEQEEEERGEAMPEEEKKMMEAMIGSLILDLNENGTYELRGSLRDEMNGTGIWTINAAGDSITLSLDGADPLPCSISFQSEEQFRFENITETSRSKSTTGFKLIKR